MPKHVDLVVDAVGLVLRGCRPASACASPRNQKPVPRIDSLIPLGRVPARLRQQVAGDVLDDELVVGQVGVEGPDDVVAVAPGVAGCRSRTRARASRRSAPGRASAGPSARRSAARPAAARPASRRRRATSSARKASISPASAAGPIRSNVTRRISVRRSASGARRQALRLQPRQDESVDRIVGSGLAILNAGTACRAKRLEGPELLASFEVERLGGRRRRPWPAGHGCAPHLDPGNEVGDLASGQLAARRHAQVGVLVADGRQQQAFLGLSRHQDAPVSPPLRTSARVSSSRPPCCFLPGLLWH